MKQVYLDYAATSPVKKEVMQEMKPYFSVDFGNASSIYKAGRTAKGAIDRSREIVANYLNCLPKEVIFTSGGTESDNLAIRGLLEEIYYSSTKLKKMHVIVPTFEHHAVTEVVKDLEVKGIIRVTYLNPNKQGIIELADIKRAIKPNTVLISVMYVNNEIGTVQPIAEIGKLVKEINQKRASYNKLYFHTDAVQAVQYQDCDVQKLGVDLLTISAHKFGGPKGVGALFIRKGTPISRQNIGGGQEFNLRSGTYNTPGIVGLGKAIELITKNKKQTTKKIAELRDYLINQVLEEIPDTSLNGSRTERNPNNANINFKYIEGEAILLNLDLVGISANSGSACTSGSLEPSHVLLAIGLKHEDAHGSIRFTLGEATTKTDIDYVVDNLKKIVVKLRVMSPFGNK